MNAELVIQKSLSHVILYVKYGVFVLLEMPMVLPISLVKTFSYSQIISRISGAVAA